MTGAGIASATAAEPPRESKKNLPGEITSPAENTILIFPDALSNSHPEISTSIAELFFNSIHSADEDDGVPIHAISFNIIFRVVEETLYGK